MSKLLHFVGNLIYRTWLEVLSAYLTQQARVTFPPSRSKGRHKLKFFLPCFNCPTAAPHQREAQAFPQRVAGEDGQPDQQPAEAFDETDRVLAKAVGPVRDNAAVGQVGSAN